MSNGKVAVSKPGYNVLTETDPSHFIFNSDYGTLKYANKVSGSLTIDAVGGDIAGRLTITHNFGYAPYVEVYLQNPNGDYEYCPLSGSGISAFWTVDYAVKLNTIDIYVLQNGFFINPTFRFLVFIFKNNTGLL